MVPMVNLSQFRDTTKSKLDFGLVQSEMRPYLGMSGIGHPCNRYLWYAFRWCFTDSYSQRVRRLFTRGHREEAAVIAELEKIGIKCYGDQTECVMVDGHVRGHCDGLCDNVPEAKKTTHLLEIKTMNDSYFKDMVKKGIQQSKPIYYAQLQLYMKGLKLTRALFICVNKNDDSYYVERVKYEAATASFLVEKAKSVVEAHMPIPAPFSKTWFECKWCAAKDICHNGGAIEKTCRTCVEVDIMSGGEWHCKLHSRKLSTEQQRRACVNYKIINL